MKILNVKYSRNGSGTAHPFMRVLFENKVVAKEWDGQVCGNIFIATFQTDGNDKMIRDTIRVTNIKNFDLNFRGDYFDSALEQLLNTYCKDLKEVSWSAAAFPDQYKKEVELAQLYLLTF